MAPSAMHMLTLALLGSTALGKRVQEEVRSELLAESAGMATVNATFLARTTPSTACDEAVSSVGEPLSVVDKALCKGLHPSLLKMLFKDECVPNMQTYIDKEMEEIGDSLKDRGTAYVTSEAFGAVGLDALTDVLGSADVVASSFPSWDDVPEIEFKYVGEDSVKALGAKTRTYQVGILALGIAAEVFLFPFCWFQCALSAAGTASAIGVPDFLVGTGFEASKYLPLRVFARLYRLMCTVTVDQFHDYMNYFADLQDIGLPTAADFDRDEGAEISDEEWERMKLAQKNKQ